MVFDDVRLHSRRHAEQQQRPAHLPDVVLSSLRPCILWCLHPNLLPSLPAAFTLINIHATVKTTFLLHYFVSGAVHSGRG